MNKNLLSYLRTSGFLITLLFSSLVAFTQTGTIRGSVRDVNGLPLAGASVVLEGTKTGTTTNTAGDYTLHVAPGT